MAALRQFSIEPESHAAWQRRLLAILLSVVAAFVLLLLRDIGWVALILPSTMWLLAAFLVLRQSTKDARLAQIPRLRDTVEMLRSLHGMPFDQACEKLDDVGCISSMKKVRLLDPRTWRHLQRQAEFECWPFSGVITEKFSRVADIFVCIDDEKEGPPPEPTAPSGRGSS